MVSKNDNEYLEEEMVSSNFEDSGSSDWESYKIQDNILAYDTDDEENNHNIITSSHNNIKVNHNNINTDISVISNASSSSSDSEVEVHKRKKRMKKHGKKIKDGKTEILEDNIIVSMGKLLKIKL
jgi:hypothetical protein